MSSYLSEHLYSLAVLGLAGLAVLGGVLVGWVLISSARIFSNSNREDDDSDQGFGKRAELKIVKEDAGQLRALLDGPARRRVRTEPVREILDDDDLGDTWTALSARDFAQAAKSLAAVAQDRLSIPKKRQALLLRTLLDAIASKAADQFATVEARWPSAGLDVNQLVLLADLLHSLDQADLAGPLYETVLPFLDDPDALPSVSKQKSLIACRAALSAQEAGRGDDAWRYFAVAKTIAPNSGTVGGVQGKLLAHEGRVEEAIAAYSHSILHNPKQAWLVIEKAILLIESGRKDEARKTLGTGREVVENTAPIDALLAKLATETEVRG